MDLKEATKRILDGEPFQKIERESMEYLAHGTYRHVDVKITPKGLDAGWIYEYPCFRFQDVRIRESGKTIEQAIIDGHMELYTGTTTAI